MIKRFTSALMSLMILATPLFSPVAVRAAADTTIKDSICAGVNASGASGCSNVNGSSDISKVLTTVLTILQVLAGILAVFYITIAGLKFITSGGGSDGVKSARNNILYSAIGLIVVLVSRLIVVFVLNKF